MAILILAAGSAPPPPARLPAAACPCCGDAMYRECIVCDECSNLTKDLTPGTHQGMAPMGTTYYFDISMHQIECWRKQRDMRLEATR